MRPLASLVLWTSLIPCGAAPARTTVFPGKDWQEATPESQGVDSGKLREAVAYMDRHFGPDGAKELVIVRNGRMIWRGPDADAYHNVWSCTKVFTSTVLGILIADGKCTLDDLAVEHLPGLDHQYPLYSKIKLRHLASMSSGYKGQVINVTPEQPWGEPVAYLNPTAPLFEAGTQVQYQDHQVFLLGTILARLAGQSQKSLFRRRIADPIGMTRWDWGVSGKVGGIELNNAAGTPTTPGIQTTARQMARLGLLYLNRGNWDGKQLLPASFVDEATRNQVPAAGASAFLRSRYGFYWWTNDRKPDGKRPWPSAPPRSYTSHGRSANFCFILPEWNMVVVRMGTHRIAPGVAGLADIEAKWDGFFATLGEAIGAERALDIRDFGAVGDGKTLCTAAIQKAIDQCAARGGGTVRLPEGTWLTGTVYLVSKLTLVLEKGCTLLGSRRHGDYGEARASGGGTSLRAASFRYPAVLAGSDLTSVTIRGEGTIDGQGDAFRDKSKVRPKNLYFQRCRDVTIEGLHLRNAGSWMQHYRHCDGLVIRKIDVWNHAAYNNDGLNVDSSRNVLIEDCRVDSDDDAIVLKSLSLDPCQDVVIRNCTASSHCNALKIGTESGGGFRRIAVSGCTVHSPRQSQKIYGAQRGLAGIALEIVDGGTTDNVTVSNIRIDGVTAPIFLRLGNRARSYTPGSPKPAVGTMRNVVLRDIVAQNTSATGCSITGLPGHPVRDVVLENVRIGFEGGGTRDLAARTVPEREEAYPECTMFGPLPAYGFYCRHVEGLVLRKVELRTRQPDLRPAVVFDDVKRLQIESLEADHAEGVAPVLRLQSRPDKAKMAPSSGDGAGERQFPAQEGPACKHNSQ